MPARTYVWGDPSDGLSLPPEARLIAAIVRQALTDAHSRRVEVRQEALAFLQDPQALAFWGDLLGLDGTLERYVQGLLRA